MQILQRGASITAALQLLPIPHVIIGAIGLALVDNVINPNLQTDFGIGANSEKGLAWPVALFLGLFTGSVLAFVAFVIGCLLQLIIPDKRISNESDPGDNDLASRLPT